MWTLHMTSNVHNWNLILFFKFLLSEVGPLIIVVLWIPCGGHVLVSWIWRQLLGSGSKSKLQEELYGWAAFMEIKELLTYRCGILSWHDNYHFASLDAKSWPKVPTIPLHLQMLHKLLGFSSNLFCLRLRLFPEIGLNMTMFLIWFNEHWTCWEPLYDSIIFLHYERAEIEAESAEWHKNM